MEDKSISIIMSVYNEKIKVLRQAVESILNQTYKNFKFIIILDNPLNKEAKDIINEYKEKDNRIIFKINEKNIGLAKSLNEGLKIAQSKYIARMDADDIASETRIEKQLRFMNDNPEIDFISSHVEYINEKDEILEDKKMFVSLNDRDKMKKGILYRDSFCHPTWFFKSSILDKVGEYRDFPCAEDYDFVMRVIDYGFNVDILQEKLLKYRIREEGITKSNRILMTKYAIYMQDLSKKRRKYGVDSFDVNYVYDLKNTENIEIKQLTESMQLLDEAKEYFNKKNYIKFLVKMMASVCKTKDQFKYLRNSLNWRMLCSKK